MFKNILVPTDGDAGSKRAAMFAVDLARRFDAQITFLHVMTETADTVAIVELLEPDPKELLAQAQTRAARMLAPLHKLATEANVRCRQESAPDDDPAKAILATARKAKCDLIVMASHKRRGLARLVLGSTTQEVLRGVSLPVLVVR